MIRSVLKASFRNSLTIFVVIIVVLTVFLRLYNVTGFTTFMGDQGVDFFVSHTIIYDQYRPMIGPILSIEHLYTPPTYYYVLALLNVLGRTPEGTVILYSVLNILLFFILYKIGKTLIDRLFGLVVISIFAVSYSMIYYGTTVWQPHFALPFVLLSLYSMILGRRRSKFRYILLSVFLYAVSISIYLGPILLLPFFLYHSVSSIKRIFGNHVSKGILYLGTVWVMSLCIVYSPQLVFEYNHHFPSVTTLLVYLTKTVSTVSNVFPSLLANLFALFSDIFPPLIIVFLTHSVIGNPLLIIAILLFFVLIVWSFIAVKTCSGDIRSRLSEGGSFMLSPWLILGFLPVILFRGPVYDHRVSAFVPFILFGIAYIIRVAFQVKHPGFKAVSLLLTGLFLMTNTYAILQYDIVRKPEYIPRIRSLVNDVSSDMAVRHIPVRAMNMYVYTPYSSQNYEALPFFYFLHTTLDYPLALNEFGNDIDRPSKTTAPYVYLVCMDFRDQVQAQRGCTDEFAMKNPDYEVLAREPFHPILFYFVLHKK